MKHRIPVAMAEALRAEGVRWTDIAKEIAWATGHIFAFDAIQAACYRARRR